MSLIITMQNQRGIVFCGDSRSSFHDSIGSLYEEKDRDTIKVFQAKNFIVGTFGRNKYISHNAIITVESAIAAIIAKAPSMEPDEFLDTVKSEWHDAFVDKSIIYEFILGHRYGKSFATEYCKLTASGWEISTFHETMIRYYGALNTLPRDVRINGNWTVKEMEKASRLLMESAISLGDCFLAYNPLSKPIRTVTLE